MRFIFYALLLMQSAVALFGQKPADSLQSTQELEEVEVVSSKSSFRLDGEKRIFDVEKNINSIGGTAEDILRNIPTINVDPNGQVNYRGGSPAIFIDGKPSDMTLDEIPASDIKQVEIISTPSAKYDASTSGGILNIVLKKNRKKGLSGMAMLRVDRFPKTIIGGNINYGYKKWNFSLRGFGGARKIELKNKTNRITSKAINPISYLSQGSGNIGLDGFFFLAPTIRLQATPKTELVLEGRMFNGNFLFDDISSTSIDSGSLAKLEPLSVEDRVSKNKGEVFFSRIAFRINKKLDSAGNSSWSTHLRGQQAIIDRPNTIESKSYNEAQNTLLSSNNQVTHNYGIYQAALGAFDLELKLSKQKKLELGVQSKLTRRAFDITAYENNVLQTNKSSKYNIWEMVNALYGSFSHNLSDKLSYQVGLRLENSVFRATIEEQTSYNIDYLLEFFPSLSINYKFDNSAQLQFSYARKVRRPNGFQTTPITDYTDPLNISRGNPNLQPAFTSLLELNYNKPITKRNSNLLLALYFKHTDGLITTFYKQEQNIEGQNVIIRTPYNSGTLYNYGIEIVPRFSVSPWYTLTPNINLLYSQILLDNGQEKIDVSNFSYFFNVSQEFKIGKTITIQWQTRYRSRSIIPPNSGGQNNSGSRIRPTINTTAQGYIDPAFTMDISIRKSWNKTWFLSLSVVDIFSSNYYRTYTKSTVLEQTSSLLSNPTYFFASLRYIFGKQRKNKKSKNNDEGDGF